VPELARYKSANWRRTMAAPGYPITKRAIPPLRAFVAIAALGGAVALSGCGSPVASTSSERGGSPRMMQAPSASGPAMARQTAVVPAASTLVATTRGAVPRFAYPGGPKEGTVPATWFAAPSSLPVLVSRPGWVRVRLAQRPNESTSWVLASDVTLTSTSYGIVIDLASRHLTLYRDSRVVFSTPVGIGLPAYPTPTGRYFVAFFAAPPNPGYGAFVIVTSAHSDTITDWDHSGDALVAIHGPLGSDAEIGSTGAAVSHGCIRMHEPDLLRLRQVPVGSPVEIVG
jgi:lipoprotein-anchoring transpeptidase ErfK/SrfK